MSQLSYVKHLMEMGYLSYPWRGPDLRADDGERGTREDQRMTDLVDFLRGRLDEDERAARAAAPGPWHMDENQRIYAEDGAYVTAPWTEDERDDDLDHIARHDPARVLREVEAKRGLLAWHDRAHPHDEDPCTTQRLLVLPYADHPDYREEWKL